MKIRSLKYQLWVYFVLFAALIMSMLWLLQIIFLNTFYQQMKLYQIESLGNSIVREFDSAEFTDLVQQRAFQNGVIIQLVDENGSSLLPDTRLPDIPPPQGEGAPRDNRGEERLLHHIRQQLEQYGAGKAFVQDAEYMRTRTAAYIAPLTLNGQTVYLYVNSPLMPVDATTQVLQNQLLIVTFVSLVIAFVLAYFISRRLARPLADITAAARQLGESNYQVTFRRGGYTEINQLADALNHTAVELSRTDTLRRDLIANVSHDLRTPLTIIKSYGEMIRDISGDNPQKRNQHAGVIVEEADRLSLLVTDMLNLSKMESGTMEIQPEVFDISTLAGDIVSRFAGFAAGYYFSLRADEAAFVYADRKRIEQVLYNLLINAMHYTGEDKQVTVAVQADGDRVLVSVTDTGCGIPPDQIPLVWNRYYKVSRGYGRSDVGSGLGLSIVKNILQLHSADFGVDSAVGQGSSFWFTLKQHPSV